MSPKVKGSLVLSVTMALALFLETGCATKKYVKQQVDPVSGRVDELTEVSKRNENAIKDVDSRAQSGIQSVQAKANEVDQKAATADQKAVEAQQMAKNADAKIGTVESNFNQKISNIDSYKPVENAGVKFKFNHADLTDEAKATLDQLAAKVKDSKGYVLEIQGFTDKIGSEDYNLSLSQKRSESVLGYLADNHQIPLFRMFILGLGESKPVEDNKTRTGREANRRVEITLLKSEIESMGTK
ncbi:MAG: flagellar motor protein MotB [Acidobacteria bacterium]|nr:MAG: flagellar motor protein MotB [Acidobacteriota bacterium]